MVEPVDSRRRIRLGRACLAIAWLAIGLGLARDPGVRWALAPWSPGVAAARLGWLWVGLAVVEARGRSIAGRFLGDALVLLGSVAILAVLPAPSVALVPDLPGAVNAGLAIAAVLLGVAGAVARTVEARRERRGAGDSS